MNIKDFFKKKGQGGKGFAAAVCLCMLVIAGAGVYSYGKISDRLNKELISGNTGTSEIKNEAGAQANAQQTQVPKAETKPAASSSAAPVTTAGAETEKAEKADIPAEGIALEKPAAAQAMVRPLNGEVLCDFSDGELVKSPTLNVWKTHDGVDIAGNRGEKVKSMTSGSVSDVYEDQLMGVCVVIDHGSGIEGFYCNLDTDVPVAKGQSVSAGTVIGAVGDTAGSEIKEGPHLHFALKKNGDWIDPIALISGEGS